MGKKNENINSGKAKAVSSTSSSYENIQPRVVLQRLSKDYTFGVPSGSDNQPSTSGYIARNKSPEVDTNLSDDTNDSTLNTETIISVTPSTSTPTTSGIFPKRKEIVEFTVAPVRVVNWEELQRIRERARHRPTTASPVAPLSPGAPLSPAAPASHSSSSSSSSSASECSYDSSPKEVVVVEENITETGECEQCAYEEAYNSDKPFTSPESTCCSDENSVVLTRRSEAKIQKAISFLKLLVEAYNSRFGNNNDQSSTSGSNPDPPRRGGRSVVLRAQPHNLKDCVVRVWLPIRGETKQKKFHVKLSQLLSLLHNKNHPLHKFRKSMNLRTLRFLSDSELRVMARLLSDFVCAKPVRF